MLKSLSECHVGAVVRGVFKDDLSRSYEVRKHDAEHGITDLFSPGRRHDTERTDHVYSHQIVVQAYPHR